MMAVGPVCPFCDSDQPEKVGMWGGQIITAQWHCGQCGSYFEAIREDFGDRDPELPPREKRRSARFR